MQIKPMMPLTSDSHLDTQLLPNKPLQLTLRFARGQASGVCDFNTFQGCGGYFREGGRR